jgi:diadenylate cyclase
MLSILYVAAIPTLTVPAVLDILLVAFLIYQLLMIVRGTRAARVLLGIFILFAIYNVAVWANLQALRSLLSSVVPYTAIAVIVVFQSEIRRTLARLGRKQLFFGGLRRLESAEEILLALPRLSESKTGALIVMERDTGLRTFIESGVPLDARVSRDLLLTVFRRDAPLHDGAAIIRKNRLAAAACFLPLSMNPALSLKLGTRHRAAIGITEETDCLSIVVSEETGAISVAAFGEIEKNVGVQRVAERITAHFGYKRDHLYQPEAQAADQVDDRLERYEGVDRP